MSWFWVEQDGFVASFWLVFIVLLVLGHRTKMLQSTARTTLAQAGLGRRAASTIATKYSKAVFSAALNKSPQTLNKVQTELTSIAASIKSTPELKTFVTNPTLSSKDRTTGLAVLYSRAGKEPVTDITKNLFVVLSENGRLSETEGVIEGFNELVAAHKGELTVTITSAAPLPKDVQTRLESTLKQSQAAQQAKALKITNKVRRSLELCCFHVSDKYDHNLSNRLTLPSLAVSSSTSARRALTSVSHPVSTSSTVFCNVSCNKLSLYSFRS